MVNGIGASRGDQSWTPCRKEARREGRARTETTPGIVGFGRRHCTGRGALEHFDLKDFDLLSVTGRIRPVAPGTKRTGWEPSGPPGQHLEGRQGLWDFRPALRLLREGGACAAARA